MKLLFIHGIAQGGKNPEDLKQRWKETLQKGYKAAGLPFPDTLEPDFPYYGDALDAAVAQSRLPMPQNLTPKGDGEASEYEQFVKKSLEEMKVKANISTQDVRAEAGTIPATEKGIQNWRLTQALARLLDRRCADLTSFTIEMFLRDVFLYMTDVNVTREINSIINEKLTNEPTIVVAHSLGTVVAYRVLLEQRARINIRRFITVGSPLGIHTISSRLGVLKYPKADLLWYNAYDKRDIVALNALKAPDFETDPVINNFGDVQNQTDNRHGIIGYLNDSTVAKSVAEALSN